jgi:hypothetical protein
MYLDMTRINHQPFKIRLFDRQLKPFFPHALVTPATKSVVRISSAAVIRGQIAYGAPVRKIQTPVILPAETGVEEWPIVADITDLCASAPCAFASRQMLFE